MTLYQLYWKTLYQLCWKPFTNLCNSTEDLHPSQVLAAPGVSPAEPLASAARGTEGTSVRPDIPHGVHCHQSRWQQLVSPVYRAGHLRPPCGLPHTWLGRGHSHVSVTWYACVHVCKLRMFVHLCRVQESVTSGFKKELDSIISTDPLTKLTTPQMELLWKFRKHCSTIPEALPKVGTN